jgi:sirohydrochlorin cobaltochelatase
MLLAAAHAKDDIPATLVREKLAHPTMSFSYGRALGIRPELLELMDKRISAVVREEEKEETAVLIVGRGSSDPDANSDLSKIARLFYEGRPYPTVESAYVSMTPPDVANGLDRCLKLGANRIVVFSYFLFTGVLEVRIREQSRAFADANPGVEVRYAGYFGPNARVADLVVERYTEALRGDIRMNCDVCVHRVALPGFEEKVGAPATPHYHPDEPGHHQHSHQHSHQQGCPYRCDPPEPLVPQHAALTLPARSVLGRSAEQEPRPCVHATCSICVRKYRGITQMGYLFGDFRELPASKSAEPCSHATPLAGC